MIKATRFFFFDVDTSNCKAMISMIKATRFFCNQVVFCINLTLWESEVSGLGQCESDTC